MKRKPRRRIKRKVVLAAVLVAILGVTVESCRRFVQYRAAQPVSAVGFAVCGVHVGTVITHRDGSQKFYAPREADVVGPIVSALPPESKGVLSAPAPACRVSDSQKVY